MRAIECGNFGVKRGREQAAQLVWTAAELFGLCILQIVRYRRTQGFWRQIMFPHYIPGSAR